MIRDQEGGFSPGTGLSTRYIDAAVDIIHPEVQGFLDDRRWEHGGGLLIVGPDGCGKTMLGLSVLHQVFNLDPARSFQYWTEQDFLADLRSLWRYEEMSQRLTSRREDLGIWNEYAEWEREFWGLKEAGVLFFDDLGRSYSPMQWYETEGLLRFRTLRDLPTIMGVSTGRWDNTPSGMKSVMSRNATVLVISEPF